jgi:hypothetical protein
MQQLGSKRSKSDRQEVTEPGKDVETEYDVEKVKEKLD